MRRKRDLKRSPLAFLAPGSKGLAECLPGCQTHLMRPPRILIPGPPNGELWTPPGTGARPPIAAPGIPAGVPPELRPRAEFIVPRTDPDADPAGDLTRCAVTLDELELDGLSGTLTSLDQVIELVRQIPFEGAMTYLAPIAADVYQHPSDSERQMKLAKRIWRPPVIERVADFVEAGPSRLVFDERNISVLQRLLVEHANCSRAAMTDEQQVLLTVLLLAVPVVLIDDAPSVADPDNPSREERDAWAYFSLRSGAYYERVDPLQAIARSRSLYIEALQDPTLSTEVGRYPFDDWMRTDHEGAGVADQLAAGLALDG